MADMSLSGWRRILLADGVVLTSPDGPDSGTIRIRTHETPLRTIPELIAGIRSRLPPSFTDVQVGDVELLHTHEGEFAALFPISATSGAATVHRTIGLIFGDDHFAAIDGASVKADQTERVRGAVRRLTTHYSLGLGDTRRRPYLYDVPAGWQGVRLHRSVVWFAPGHPRAFGQITVFDARPGTVTHDHLQDRMLLEDLSQDFTPGPPQAPIQVVTKGGLRGQITIVNGEVAGGGLRIVHTCALNDGKTLYMLRLETDEAHLAAHRGVFMDVVHSVKPMPVKNTNPGSFILWQD